MIRKYILSPHRSRLAAATLITVAFVTSFAVVGLHPRIGWITVEEALMLAGLNLLSASIYFEFLSPCREKVPKYVTSSLAIFAGIIASLTVHVYFNALPEDTLEFLGIGAFLLLIVANWLWYEIFILGSFRERVGDVVHVAPVPAFIEKALREEEDE